VGVHDTGSLRYVGQRPTYDLIGLTTTETTRAWRNGMGSVFERMERSPYRPDYFAIYPDVFSIPYLAATDLFARQLFRVEVSEYAVVSAGPVQGVWQADWRLSGSGARMAQSDVLARLQGLDQVDALDVADLYDEAAHQLRWWHGSEYGGFPTEVYQMRYHAPPHVEVLDGGRLVGGGIRFQVTTQPGQPLTMVARLHAQQAGAVQVTVGGNPIGRWAFPGLPGAWLETVFSVPAEAIAGERTEVRLDVEGRSDRPARYAAYTFWFLQGAPHPVAPHISHPLDVRFDGEIHLLGFDLERDVLLPGEALSATLYWRLSAPVDSGAKVFLHLYDAQGSLGPQADGWPVFGTRPPYTWQVGEIVADRRTLTLSPDMPAGRYSLEVGLYDQAGRLAPAPEEGQAFYENRVPLTHIEVRKPE
jgi:hypothetical protein